MQKVLWALAIMVSGAVSLYAGISAAGHLIWFSKFKPSTAGVPYHFVETAAKEGAVSAAALALALILALRFKPS